MLSSRPVLDHLHQVEAEHTNHVVWQAADVGTSRDAHSLPPCLASYAPKRFYGRMLSKHGGVVSCPEEGPPMLDGAPTIITVEGAAKCLNLRLLTVRRLARDATIPAVQVGTFLWII